LVGTIVEVKIRGILAQVVLAIGEQRITAIITADARARCSCARARPRRP